jgi:hypothetical protein
MQLTNRAAVLALIVLLSLLGCSNSDQIPTGLTTRDQGITSVHPNSSGSEFQGLASFYPLNVGNRWIYVDRASKVWISNGDTIAVKRSESSVEVVQAGMEEMDGRLYMREEIRDSEQPGERVRWRREDRTGLYEFGPLAHDLPFGEQRLLAYPLHVGSTWMMFVASRPTITATVEGTEVLETPAGRFVAWRIRISGEIRGDQVVCYGRAGYLGQREHDQGGRADSSGLQVFFDQTESLTSTSIQRASGPVHPPQTP